MTHQDRADSSSSASRKRTNAGKGGVSGVVFYVAGSVLFRGRFLHREKVTGETSTREVKGVGAVEVRTRTSELDRPILK